MKLRSVLPALLLLLLCGCTGKDSLVGTWDDGHGDEYTFDYAGHITHFVTTDGTIVEYHGLYKLNGKTLMITLSNAQSPDKKALAGADALIKADPESAFTLSWFGPNVVQFQGKLGETMFKRK